MILGIRSIAHSPTIGELLTRQEMTQPNVHGGTPDILITNYSMLEYMLLRPLEQPIFRSTREWFKSDPNNQLILVIDEAHLYRGAQGAEVALLIRRLLNHLGVGRDRVRCILTSASLGESEPSGQTGRIFASKLTGGAPEQFEVILGKRIELGGKPPLPKELGEALLQINRELEPSSLNGIARFYGWKSPLPADIEALRRFLGKELPETGEYRTLHDALSRRVMPIQDAARELFPSLSPDNGSAAVLNFALLANGPTA